MNQYKIDSLFPEAIIYKCKLEIFNEEILNYIKSCEFEINEEHIYNSNCYISKKMDVFSDLENLKNEIEKHVQNYIYNILCFKMKYRFLNSWITKTPPKGFSQKHVHKNTFLSGVYYPVKNNDFKIKFFKKKENFFNILLDKINIYNCTNVTYPIDEDNLLIIFPSDLSHMIEKNISNEDRYSIAFNINPAGLIGFKDTAIYF